GIGEPLDIGLYLRERRTLVLLLGGQHLELCVLARAIFGGRQLLIVARGLERTVVRAIAVCIVLQRLQRIRHIHERRDHGAVIGRERLGVALLGFVRPSGEAAAVKQRRREVEAGRPDAARPGEELVELGSLLGVLRGKAELRQPRRLGDADFRAGSVQTLFCRKDVGTLLYERRRQRYGQLTGQREVGERPSRHAKLIRRLAAETREGVAVGVALLLQVGERRTHVLELRLCLQGVAVDDFARVLQPRREVVLRLQLAYQRAGNLDPGLDGRIVEGGDDDLIDERHVGIAELIAHRGGLRLLGFDRAAHAPERVQVVGQTAAVRDQLRDTYVTLVDQ